MTKKKNVVPCHNQLIGSPKIKPFLRWAGGKSRFVNTVLSCFPSRDNIGDYYEPFLGAGSVFLSYAPEQAVLSDLNDQLISTFSAVKDNPSTVLKYLRDLVAKDSEQEYYWVEVKMVLAKTSKLHGLSPWVICGTWLCIHRDSNI